MASTTRLGGVPTTKRLQEIRLAMQKVARRPQFWFGAAVLVPTLAWYCVFAYFPILRGFWLAVFDYSFISHQSHGFIGLTNFGRLFQTPLIFTSLRNTVVLAVLEFAFLLPISLFVATCLNNIRRAANLYQALFSSQSSSPLLLFLCSS